MKVIAVRTPNGQVGIPLQFIAEHRASHYADKGSEEWNEEVNIVLDDNFEGLDWFSNNMDWEDVDSKSILLDEANFCSSDEGDFDQDSLEIIEHEA